MADEHPSYNPYANIRRIDDDETSSHLTEYQLVDYVQEEIGSADLHSINLHLIACRRCAERLSSLILFAAETNLLNMAEEKVITDYLTSPDYSSMKVSFIRRAIDSYKSKGFALIRRFARKRRRLAFSFSFDIKLI